MHHLLSYTENHTPVVHVWIYAQLYMSQPTGKQDGYSYSGHTRPELSLTPHWPNQEVNTIEIQIPVLHNRNLISLKHIFILNSILAELRSEHD